MKISLEVFDPQVVVDPKAEEVDEVELLKALNSGQTKRNELRR